MIIKDGPFDMYFTHGETNVPLRRGDAQEFIMLERGFELLTENRAWEVENF